MKQHILRKMAKASRTGSLVGAILSFFVYVFARVLFYEFSFTAREEVINFFTIILAGAVFVSLALMAFLLLESILNYLVTWKTSSQAIHFNDDNTGAGTIEYPMAELNRTA